jgi:structure-specific endonuclease subunit SLX1
MSKYYCYILRSTDPLYNNVTYNGSTNNLKRRLRQHNGEIVGGARYTRSKRPWEYYAVLEGFSDKVEALCCEWRIKHPTNKKIRPKIYCGQIGRVKSLNLVLNLEKWTKNTICNVIDKNYTLYLSNDMIDIIDKEFINNIQVKSIDELIY